MVRMYYICQECGYKTSKWLGKCPECGSWNSFVEEAESDDKGFSFSYNKLEEVFSSVTSIESIKEERFFTGISEFDRVTGGILKGQIILLSGEPGIGKTTLSLKVASSLAPSFKKVIYINGEESNFQMKSKITRLGIEASNMFLFPETNVEKILEKLSGEENFCLIVDSIQTIYTSSLSALPGSVVQVKASSYSLIRYCKETGNPLILIGHITKTGDIAGPKVLEHIVDTLIFFESDKRGNYRVLRSLKNRFYRTDEIGIFSMGEDGLMGVEEIDFDPLDLDGRSGVAFYLDLEGNRVIPTEIQSLCLPAQLSFPRRISEGVDINRLFMLIAIIEKNLKIFLGKYDIYLNVTNGLTISDSSSDISVILSIYSSYKDLPIPSNFVSIGEVSLTGELRMARNVDRRMKEGIRYGFKNFIIPYRSKEQLKNIQLKEDIKIYPLRFLKQAIELIF